MRFEHFNNLDLWMSLEQVIECTEEKFGSVVCSYNMLIYS